MFKYPVCYSFISLQILARSTVNLQLDARAFIVFKACFAWASIRDGRLLETRVYCFQGAAPQIAGIKIQYPRVNDAQIFTYIHISPNKSF